MLDIIPVIHVGGTKEYRKYPGIISPPDAGFGVKGTQGYLINIVSNRENYDPVHKTSNRKVFCDSGGLQLGTVGFTKDTPTPRQVMQWMNQSTDVGFVVDDLSVFRKFGEERVDLPTLARRIREAGTGPLFQKCAESTAKNINEMMKVKDSKVELFCIVQGFSHEQLTLFHSIVTKEHDLDGFGMKALTPSSTVEALAWIWDNAQKPIHILGNGRIGKTYPLIYFAQKFKHPMTADSTTWYSGAMFRKFYKQMGDLTYATPNDVPTGPPRLACTCQVCEWGNGLLDSGRLKQTDYLFAHILSTHNWQMMMDDHVYATTLAAKPELFMEHAETFDRYQEEMGSVMSDPLRAPDVVRAIDMIHDGEGAKAVAQYCGTRTMTAEAFF